MGRFVYQRGGPWPLKKRHKTDGYLGSVQDIHTTVRAAYQYLCCQIDEQAVVNHTRRFEQDIIHVIRILDPIEMSIQYPHTLV